MKRKSNGFKRIAVFMIGVIFVCGIANSAYCGEETMTITNNSKLEASLSTDEIASLNNRAERSTELADIRSGDSLVEEHPYILLIGTLAVAALLLIFGGD